MLTAYLYCPLVVLGTEIFAYCWHRFAAHSPYFVVDVTHTAHHRADLSHQANQDFIWLLLLFIAFEVVIYFTLILGYINITETIIILACSFVTLMWNWYVHRCYHTDDNLLCNYSWFQRDRELHLLHHDDDYSNYGIASHFMDILCCSYKNDR